MTRRAFLHTSATGLLTIGPAGKLLAKMLPPSPFRIGIQSYSLRGMKLDAALEATKKLGLGYWEGWEGHIPISEDLAARSDARWKLKQAGVRMETFGVVGFGADDAKNRSIFDFAQSMGVRTLSADPTPDSFDSLSRLVGQFDIRIAIHNHGPGSRYDRGESVWRSVKDRRAGIGACVDTGHYLRSQDDPVKVVEMLGERVYGVHLKDVKDATKFTLLGQGDLDTVGLLRTLIRNRFDGLLSLEYEENPQNPMADLTACFEYLGKAIAQAMK